MRKPLVINYLVLTYIVYIMSACKQAGAGVCVCMQTVATMMPASATCLAPVQLKWQIISIQTIVLTAS